MSAPKVGQIVRHKLDNDRGVVLGVFARVRFEQDGEKNASFEYLEVVEHVVGCMCHECVARFNERTAKSFSISSAMVVSGTGNVVGFVPEPYVTDTRKPLIGTRRRGT